MIVSRSQSKQNFGMAVKLPKKMPIEHVFFFNRALRDEADRVDIRVKKGLTLQEFSLFPPKLDIRKVYKVLVSHLEDKTANTAFELPRRGARAHVLKENVANARSYVEAVIAQKKKWG